MPEIHSLLEKNSDQAVQGDKKTRVVDEGGSKHSERSMLESLCSKPVDDSRDSEVVS